MEMEDMERGRMRGKERDRRRGETTKERREREGGELKLFYTSK